MDATMRRRDVLCGLAVAGAWLLSGTAAHAITVRTRSDYGAVLDNACGASLDHTRQIAAVEEALGLALPDDRLIGVLQRTVCATCGCPLMPPATGPAAF
ncbi:hypothetical protein [Azospirillum doebereinerae]|uniref:Uncharacterized protein n=1 Tax=Azospirillum doebereinerae TaxID=92933 RepID=A0A3S0VEX3_9PROT|nr:hypothetical protein [Azospirillum doebereinerae]MCG5242302.1 hypothetical protein [Azospirillum doebereinerae]RUQ65145.1 hypothetical protein EJ913_25705 [Azospirillum doebereinerae]